MPTSQTATITPDNRRQWRAWLQKNHDKEQSIWLVYRKKAAQKKGITYAEAVEEALCFGWIDSLTRSIDDETYMQVFSRRKVKSVWSKLNKERVRKLTEAGKMMQAGLDIIETGKQNGSWTILDEVEELVVPEDLQQALKEVKSAEEFFSGMSRSDRRNILQWLVLAKRPETREKRITEIAALAGEGKKPKQFSRKP